MLYLAPVHRFKRSLVLKLNNFRNTNPFEQNNATASLILPATAVLGTQQRARTTFNRHGMMADNYASAVMMAVVNRPTLKP